eukprot:CAMPEP_0198140862 /NCGR_PEP_ID=MMETSP1443-20131203/3949_1 /TAXON_ID=186043 /ORGANISM="Entomoneis sp., Strain CCMP2396" /LENGTH=419 /DNA_ID=CAMNT_0043803403 /DNA_START=52 /DNA_END=1311 /DNA_ORIENTATION=+
MVRLNVFFVRHGLAENEGYLNDEENLAELPNMAQLMKPSKKKLNKLTNIIDPPLTEEGYLQVQDSLRALAKSFTKIGEKRRIALISEPFRRCTSSALMVSSAGFEPQEWSEWGLTMPLTLAAPSAIPIVIENGFIDAQPAIRKMGGYKGVIDGGLVHCAAEHWNKAYKKDPIMGVVQEMKDTIQDRVKSWVHAGVPTDDPDEYRFAADVQYLRCEKEGDPYSLTRMSLKFNLTSDLLKPNKILDPHRSGMYHSKLPPTPDSVSQETLDRMVDTARKTACDTVILIVTSELIDEVMQRIGVDPGEDLDEPGTIFSMVAKTKKGGEISWKLHHIVPCGQFRPENLPPFSGPIDVSMEPPTEFREAMERVGDGEKWGAFPRPPIENIPPRYPKIPPFSKCLSLPEPTDKWAWVHVPGGGIKS